MAGMKLLVLGGTAFLGREVAGAALGRGHEVTCLARGSAPPPDGVSFVTADRDAEDGLAAVAGEHWDCVVDVTGQPGQARRAVRDLRTDHWVFVSTANVYAPGAGVGADESAPLLEPLDGDVMGSMEDYGPAKVACERVFAGAEAPAALLRVGLIGGPGDRSGRSGYWPWRFAHPVGEEVVVPDDPAFPTALVDVRDLARWIVLAAEQHLDGPVNVTGPTTPLGEVLAAAAAAAGSSARPHPVAPARLAEFGISPWMGPASLPLWIDDPSLRGFGTLDSSRARAAGLVTRPLEGTFRDVLAWEEAEGRQVASGLGDEDERRVLAMLSTGPQPGSVRS